ncbi:MAG: indoleacetamide hydrolase [Acidiferrobacterales bacterium]|nr:indoleacetamide hydrolase [Acidiferrobacterales bacterium]
MGLCDLSLSEAAACIRQGDVSAQGYAQALLERCDAAQSLNAFVWLDRERLLGEARKADRMRRKGHDPGRLHGVPLAVKDCFDVAGTPTTACTPALRDNVPQRTAPIVQRLFDEGALMLGKTNMHELAFGITSDNAFTGPVRNPYDPRMSPGGSSGGTAAAVAARMAPAGLGTDTSGSVRIPAAHCGVVGYRPSTGRYPSKGIVPMNHTRDAPGLMARTVGDIALLDEVISGEGSLRPVRLRGIRFGLPGDYFFADLDNRIATAIDVELRRLRDLGVEFVETDPPHFAAARGESTEAVMAWEMPRDVERYLQELGQRITFEELVASVASPYVKSELEKILDAASPDLESRYQQAVHDVIPRHRDAYRAYLQKNDLHAIAFPTTPLAPAPLGQNDTVNVDGQEISVWRTLRNAVPATLLGAPSLTLPIGLTDDGLPVGIELDGLPGSDRDLLSIGLVLESASDAIPAPRL